MRKQLARHPGDVAWVEARIALYLLSGDYEQAIPSLDRALDSWPDRPVFLLDQAIALAQKARALSREDLFAPAFANLTRLIQTSPELRPVALYDRAVLDREMLLFWRAQEDWKLYLQAEPSGGWSVEARKRALEKTAKSENNPKDWLHEFRSIHKEQYPVERFIDTAITDWLPRNASADPQVAGALHDLAQSLVEKHGDFWLRDLLKDSSTPAWGSAVKALSHASALHLSGQRAAAAQEYEGAIHAFERAHNRAGVLGASVDRIYVLNRSLTIQPCFAAAQGIEPALAADGYVYPLIRYLIEVSGCETRAHRFVGAERDLKRAIGLAHDSGYSALELRALSILSEYYYLSGNPIEAWNASWRGLNTFRSGDYGAVRGNTLYFNLSRVNESLGFPEAALAMAQEANYFGKQTANRLQIAEGLFLEGRLSSRIGDPAAAKKAFDSGQDLLNALPDDEVRRRYQWLLARAQAQADIDRHLPAQALTVLDGYSADVERQGLPSQSLDYYSLRAQAVGALGNREEEYRLLWLAAGQSELDLKTIGDEAGRMRWRVNAGVVFRRLVELTLEKPNGPGEALRLWEWYLDRSSSAALSRSAWNRQEPLPLQNLTSTTLVTFIWLRERVGVWIANSRGVTFRWVPAPASRLAATCRRFVRQCSDNQVPEPTVRRTAQELRDQLLPPLLEGTLLIEPDGELGTIPFEALADSSGRYLGESHAVIYSPGLRRWQNTRKSAVAFRNSDVLVVSAPAVTGKLASQFPPLPGAAEEGAQVAAKFQRAVSLTGREGTLEAVKLNLPRARFFHFAGHGLSNSDDGALLLATTGDSSGGSFLTTASLAGESLARCQLVVLSACSSGAGERKGPVNPNSLVNGFLRAGVRDVVASRWRVDSSAAAALMPAFYEALFSTGDVAIALQRASQQLRQNPSTNHPFFWSAFSVFGV